MRKLALTLLRWLHTVSGKRGYTELSLKVLQLIFYNILRN